MYPRHAPTRAPHYGIRSTKLIPGYSLLPIKPVHDARIITAVEQSSTTTKAIIVPAGAKGYLTLRIPCFFRNPYSLSSPTTNIIISVPQWPDHFQFDFNSHSDTDVHTPNNASPPVRIPQRRLERWDFRYYTLFTKTPPPQKRLANRTFRQTTKSSSAQVATALSAAPKYVPWCTWAQTPASSGATLKRRRAWPKTS
jgi:hypothetical protein